MSEQEADKALDMTEFNVISSALPAGGGEYELTSLTIGIFRNDQPSHRFSLGKDKTKHIPLIANQGWILPATASGLCSYDDPLDVLMVEISSSVLTEVGMPDPSGAAPIVGDIDPLARELAVASESFKQGGTLYRETMHRALAAQLAKLLLPPSDETRVIEDARLRRVVEYIHDHLADDLSLKNMSDIAAMSGFHFSRAFKAATGKSPLQYVIAERMSLAKVLLKTTKLTVSEICFRVGYNDLSRFGQHFKRTSGTTPAKFRNR